MQIASHLEKISRLEALRARLDPSDDFEIWFWAAMTAATNGINAAHHHLGLAEVTPFYPHQIPGVYVEPQPVDGVWKKVIAQPGDVIHIGLPPLKDEPPEYLCRAYVSLEKLESYRERYVRGNEPITQAVIGEVGLAYHDCMSIVRRLLPELAP